MKQRRNFNREFELVPVNKLIQQGRSYAEVARDRAIHGKDQRRG